MDLNHRQTSNNTSLTEMVFRQSAFVWLLGLAVSILTFALLRKEISSPWLVYWLVAQFGLNLSRFITHYVLQQKHEITSNSLVMRIYGTSIFLAGLLWGSLTLFLGLDLSAFGQAYIYIILTGVSTGGLAAYAARTDFYLAFIGPILLPLIIWSYLQPESTYTWLALLIIAFAIMQIFLGHTIRGYLMRSNRLLDENTTLLMKMSDANASLERQVRSRKQFENELERDRNLFQQGPVVIYRCVAEGNWPIEWASNNIHQFGYLPAQIVGTELASLIHPEDLVAVEGIEFSEAEIMAGTRTEYRIKRADGEYCWVSDYSMPVVDAETGKVTHRDGYLLDISQLHAANIALDEEKERAQVTLRSIGDAVITTNTHGRIDFMNPVAEQLTGWRFEQAKYSPLKDILRLHSDVIGEWLEDPLDNFFSISGDNEARQLQGELHAQDGRITTITYNVSPIRDLIDHLIGYVIVFHDVTEKRALQEELEYQARHDALTGLYNRREFEGRLQRLLKRSRRESEHHVLVYVDLDHFKLVNDTCGHGAGDELLKQLTQQFRETLRTSDVLARLGGDEFGILLPGCDVEKGQEIAEKIRQVAEQYRFVWGDKSFDVGASIGLVPVTHESESVQSLLSAADVACYIAKDLGRNRIHVYLESDTEMHRRRIEMNWAGRISSAIKESRLYLSYQDIVPVSNSGASNRHIEILLRMQDDSTGTIMPGAFLSAAERYNLMPELDRWVVKSAFEWYERQGYSSELLMAINLSGLSISSTSFLEYVQNLFTQLHVPPSAVCFEITETAAIANLSAATRFMGELQRLGCRFALDDFGSGLSSFAYLKTLPVDFLKIDGHFVRDMLNDKVDRAMISAINDVGHTMNLLTIAEYVESQEIFEELGRLDVDFAQGYAISKPQPLQNLQREDTYKMIVRQQGLIN